MINFIIWKLKKITVKLLKPINYRNIKNINLDDFHEKMEQLGIDKSFVVAVSGGPDSLALMFLAKEYALKAKVNDATGGMAALLEKVGTKKSAEND